MLIAVFKLLAVSLTLIDARVSLLDGQSFDGKLNAISQDSVALQVDGEVKTLPTDNVLSVEFSAGTKSDLPEVILHDRSVVKSRSIQASAELVDAESTVLGKVSVPRTAVRALQLQKMKPEWQAEWSAFLERENAKDVLVVVKRDNSGLDFLTGVVSAVGAEDVPFLLDGDEIPVPRTRVFGVVFPPADQTTSELRGSIALKTEDGTTVKVSAVTTDGDQLRLTSSWGQSLTCALTIVQSIDFSGGRLHYLSDLEPVSEKYFGLAPAGQEWGDLFADDLDTRTGLSSQWRMSRDQFPNNGRPPLTLREKRYRKGVCIFPRAAVAYALDGRYSRLKALVGVDDEVAFNQQQGKPPTAVELRIETDGKEVFRKLVTAPDDPIALDVDVQNVTTLVVIVDFGDDSSTCDYLDLADARLIVDTSNE